MNLQPKYEALLKELCFADPDERFSYLIERAQSLPELPADKKVDAFQIRGCQSQLWLVPSLKENLCYFAVDSDAIITKAVAGIFAELFSECSPEAIVEFPKKQLDKLGIIEHLSPSRRNGLSNVLSTINSYAEHFKN